MRIMPYDTDSQSRNADFISIALKGETTLYILRVASAPSSTAVTDSLDFQVADAPLQIQFASAKCVRCAPQSGNPQPSAAEPLSPPERSDATLLHNPRRSRAPFPSKPAAPAATATFGPKRPVKPKSPPAIGRSNLRTFLRPLKHNPSTQPAPTGAPLFILRRQPPPQPSGPKGPSNLRTLWP